MLTANVGWWVHAVQDELVVLNPRQKVQLPLVERIELNRNTRIFRFGLPSPEHRIGLPVGKHVFVYANVNGQNVVRAYTPITGDEEKGRLDMLIKVGCCCVLRHQLVKIL